MANIRSLMILNKLETLLAIRSNKITYTQISNTREDSFDGRFDSYLEYKQVFPLVFALPTTLFTVSHLAVSWSENNREFYIKSTL